MTAERPDLTPLSFDPRMAAELREAPDAVACQGAALARPLAELAGRLTRSPPAVVVTCARGSSAHAATYGKHLIERHLGIPVAEAAPNIASIYRQRLHLSGQLFLAISQSGRSDDLIAQAQSARDAGAITAALVNDTESPLAQTCHHVLPMAAGAERSVAATKTFIASLAALARLVGSWRTDARFTTALDRLPERLRAAAGLDWRAIVPRLQDAASLVTIGRGPTLAIAREAALKLKETCNLHAEAFSGAEFMHGPVALVAARYPLLMFVPDDESGAGMRELAQTLSGKGAAVFCAQAGEGGGLPTLASDHPDLDAITQIQTFYALLPQLAAARGTDADRPRHLQKVTRTR